MSDFVGDHGVKAHRLVSSLEEHDVAEVLPSVPCVEAGDGGHVEPPQVRGVASVQRPDEKAVTWALADLLEPAGPWLIPQNLERESSAGGVLPVFDSFDYQSLFGKRKSPVDVKD